MGRRKQDSISPPPTRERRSHRHRADSRDSRSRLPHRSYRKGSSSAESRRRSRQHHRRSRDNYHSDTEDLDAEQKHNRHRRRHPVRTRDENSGGSSDLSPHRPSRHRHREKRTLPRRHRHDSSEDGYQEVRQRDKQVDVHDYHHKPRSRVDHARKSDLGEKGEARDESRDSSCSRLSDSTRNSYDDEAERPSSDPKRRQVKFALAEDCGLEEPDLPEPDAVDVQRRLLDSEGPWAREWHDWLARESENAAAERKTLLTALPCIAQPKSVHSLTFTGRTDFGALEDAVTFKGASRGWRNCHGMRLGDPIAVYKTPDDLTSPLFTSNVENPELTGILDGIDLENLTISIVCTRIKASQVAEELEKEGAKWSAVSVGMDDTDLKLSGLFRVIRRKEDPLVDAVCRGGDTRILRARYSALCKNRKTGETYRPEVKNQVNSSQKKALKYALGCDPISFILGPPGTGKSSVIAMLLRALLRNPTLKILVTSASNKAVNVLIERCQDLECVVLSHICRAGKAARRKVLFKKVEDDPSVQRLVANSDKTLHTFDTPEDRRTFAKVASDVVQARRSAARRAIKRESLCFGTITSVFRAFERGNFSGEPPFDVVIYDEASQSIHLDIAIAASLAKRMVLVGDYNQLQPMSSDATFSPCLLEVLTNKHPDCTAWLEVQFRMRPELIEWPSQRFYQGRVQSDDQTKALPTYKDCDGPLLWIDTRCTGNYTEVQEGNAILNPVEAHIIVNYLKEASGYMTPETTVGIISPYRAQTGLIRSLIDQQSSAFRCNLAITTSTVDGFQGDESDVIIISFVRSNKSHKLGFITDYRRLNVTLTRAKSLCVIVGDSFCLSINDDFKDLFEFISSNYNYKTHEPYLSQKTLQALTKNLDTRDLSGWSAG